MAADNQLPADPMPEPALLALARKHFGTLSGPEEELFRAAQEGRAASAFSRDNKENNPADAANWTADRVVRAECIRWVCTDPQAVALMTYRGLDLQGMRIDGALDLEFSEIKFSLRARCCAFSGDISLWDAQLRGFYLLACQIKSLNASRATIEGSLFLRGEGFKAEGEVNLVGTTIGGSLDCEGAHFLNAKRLALIANGAKIGSYVFLRDGFKAEGEVNLVGIEIGGKLDCGGARFSNAERLALHADSARIEGGVFLCDGFRAEGTVNFIAATVGTLKIRDVIEADKLILDLRHAKAEMFWDDEESWPKAGNLFLDGFRYERLFEEAPFEADKRKKWLSLQPRDRFRPQPYEQLAAVLRQMGHDRDSRQITIEKNRERASFTCFPRQGWWWYNLFGKLIGYGYRPGRAFFLSLAMILLGTLLFAFGSAHGLISPTSENAYAKEPNGQVIGGNKRPKISEEYPVFNAFFYSLESFTPLLELDQSANWRPNANRSTEISGLHWKVPTGSLLRYYLYFHIASGWLLTSLWVGAITGLVKT